ncbi:MAG: DUF4907 domain-containing protein [Bacteroidetes bacterium]|nr:DUF4907 domain-containing protein [Bacteroidota bacterium]
MKNFIFILSLILLMSCNSKQNNKEGVKITTYYTLKDEEAKYDSVAEMELKNKQGYIEILNIENGTFGYFIQYDGMKVKQLIIPGASGKGAFRSKEDAEKVAAFVLYKMKNKVFPPSVSLHELDSLKVQY